MNTIFNKEIFAQRLKLLLEENNDTIYDLAEYLHLSPSAISKYCNAINVPKLIIIDKIAEKYNVNPIWLHGIDVPKHTKSYNTKKIKTYKVVNNELCLLESEYETVNNGDEIDFAISANSIDLTGYRIIMDDIIYCSNKIVNLNGKLCIVVYKNRTMLCKFYKLTNCIILKTDSSENEFVLELNEQKNIEIIGIVKGFKSYVKE